MILRGLAVSDQQLNNLIKILEQIIANNLHHGDAKQVAAIACDHLQKFWARSIKQLIMTYAYDNPTELSAIAQLTVTQVQDEQQKSQTL